MSKEKSRGQKTSKTAPSKTPKEKKAAKLAKKLDKENSGKIIMPGSR